jgi:xanthine dehydrogenase/oxidase
MIRERNMYKEGELTPFEQPLEGCNIGRMWREVHEKAEVDRRQAEVSAYNAEHKWRKRGLAVTPCKFGMSFTANGALTALRRLSDGSLTALLTAL